MKPLSKKKRTNDKRRGRIVILTSSPYKNELELAVQMKKTREEEKGEKRLKFVSVQQKSTGKAKKITSKKGVKGSKRGIEDTSYI
jgi:hypothetical protein